MARNAAVIFSHWFHLLEGLQESPKSFYTSLEELIKKRNLPEVSLSRTDYREGGIFSAKREYFRVQRKGYIFDICAAPFGQGFFISWWLGESPSAIQSLLLNIPLLGPMLANQIKPATYFQYDTTLMFQESIHAAVLESLDQLTAGKGIRALTEAERKPILNNLFR